MLRIKVGGLLRAALLPVAVAPAYCLPQAYLQHPGTLYQSFDDTSAWTSPDGAIQADHVNVKEGASSLNLTCVPGSSAHAYKPIYTNFANVSTISMWVDAQYPASDAGWHAVSLYLTPDGFQDTFVAVTQKIRPGWSKIVFSKNDFAKRGNPSWSSTMTTLQVALFGDTGTGMSASFDDLVLNEYSRPKVIVAFDDNFASCYTYGYQYLKKYGMAGTAYVVSSWVNQPNRATTAQLNEMYNYGWDMCNHTTTHPNLTTVSPAQIQSEYQTCEQFLISNGWTRNQGYLHLAYPQGHFDADVLNADQQAGLLTARTTMETTQADCVDSPYLLYSMVPDSTTQTRAEIIASIDEAVADGTCLILTFHNITPNPQKPIDWRDTDFYPIVDHIAALRSQGMLDVTTFTQWYQGLQPPSATLALLRVFAPQWTGGIADSGTVTVASASTAPVVVALAGDNTAVHLPSTVTIPPGSSSASFGFATSSVAANTLVTITASVSGSSRSATLTLLPVLASLLRIDNASISGAGTVWAQPYLTGPAPAGGAVVQLTANNSAVNVPGEFVVPQGNYHTDFPIYCHSVSVATAVTITANYGGATVSSSLTLMPPSPRKR